MLNPSSTIEKNDILVSVILPVYNVEKYLIKCLDSVIRQTYQKLEIILVDDGSTDSSGKICDDYANKDGRIKIFHKKNGGLSDARNYGIERSTGEYLAFIDSDDYVDDDYIEFLMNLTESGKYKISLCSLHVVFTGSDRIMNKGNGKRVILNPKTCIEMMCYHEEVETAAYAKLLHRSLFNNVRFPVGKIFEDIGTSYLLFDQCKEIPCCFVPKYYYVIRENSIVTSSFTKKKLDFIEMTDQMADYVDEKYPDLKTATKRRRLFAYFSTLNQMLDEKDEQVIEIRNQLISYIKSNGFVLLKNKRVPQRDVLAYLCLKCGFSVYRAAWKTYLKIQRG